MSTRVIQLDIFQAGFRDDSDVVVNGGSVEFYTADQTYTTPKNAYTTKDKSATLTSVTLNANGAYPTGLYFDGATVYDFRLKDSDGATVRNYTNVKIPQSTSNIRTVTGTTTATVDDDAILADGTFTVNLYPVADFVSPVVVKNIGTGTITVDADGSELIDGETTATITAGVARQYWSDGTQWYAAATVTGTDFTDTNLVSGTNNTFDSAGGVTTVNVPDASATTKGAIKIATDAEVTTGASAVLAVNPLQFKTLQNVLQVVSSTDATGGSTTNTIPNDDTIPQISEGAEIASLAITPISATSTLYIRANGLVSNGTAGQQSIVAAFQDSTVDAIVATKPHDYKGANTQTALPFSLTAIIASTDTVETTFSFRYGSQGATCQIGAAGPSFGASAILTFEVWEVL